MYIFVVTEVTFRRQVPAVVTFQRIVLIEVASRCIVQVSVTPTRNLAWARRRIHQATRWGRSLVWRQSYRTACFRLRRAQLRQTGTVCQRPSEALEAERRRCGPEDRNSAGSQNRFQFLESAPQRRRKSPRTATEGKP